MSTRKRKKVVTMRGKVLSFVRANGKWMAVVASFTSRGTDMPVLSCLMDVAELKGAARRKADRWIEYLA